MMDVIPIPQLSDNYAYLIVDPSTREAGVVDCAEAAPVLAEATRRHGHAARRPRDAPSLRPRRRQRGLIAPRPVCASTATPTTRRRIPGMTDRLREGDAVASGRFAAA